MSTVYDVVSASLQMSPFKLRRCVANNLTLLRDVSRLMYSCPDILRLKRAIMYKEHVAGLADMMIMTLLFRCDFVPLLPKHTAVLTSCASRHRKIFLVDSDTAKEINAESLDPMLRSSLLQRRALPRTCCAWHPFSAVSMTSSTDLVMLGPSSLHAITHFFVFGGQIMLNDHNNPLVFLENLVLRADVLRIGFCIIDRNGTSLGNVGPDGDVDLVYYLVCDDDGWFILAYNDAPKYYFSSLESRLPQAVHPSTYNLGQQLLREYLSTSKGIGLDEVTVRTGDICVIINNTSYTAELLFSKKLQAERVEEVHQVLRLLPGFIPLKVRVCKKSIVTSRIGGNVATYDLIHSKNTVVGNRDRCTLIKASDGLNFLDWRMVYLSKYLGFIPDAHNPFLSIDIVDPVDISPPPKDPLDRWSIAYLSNNITNVTCDYKLNIRKKEITLETFVKSDNPGRLTMCPLFIEPNAFLDKLGRFIVKKSDYLMSKGVPEELANGLFASRTLLQGVKYPQLQYCGEHIQHADLITSQSLYIWQFSKELLVDGAGCPWCLAKYVNSSDCILDGVYVDLNDLQNVEMFGDLYIYIPCREIMKGEEILTMYSKTYWQ
jgi:hypothetical protein